MLRTLVFSIGLVIVIGATVAIAAWPRANAAGEGFASDGQLMLAYARVHEGMSASRLAGLGFDPARARRLSALALMERFMPKDLFAFDAMDPAVQACFQGGSDCSAYIFPVARSRAQAVLLIEGGRVAWKSVSGVRAVDIRRAKRVAQAR